MIYAKNSYFVVGHYNSITDIFVFTVLKSPNFFEHSCYDDTWWLRFKEQAKLLSVNEFEMFFRYCVLPAS